jgi:hypothetical protein
MIDIYLKATTRTALVEKLVAAGLMVEDTLAEGVSLDEIGEISKIGDTDEIKVIAGYHANLRLAADLTDEQIAALGDVVVAAPKTPYRVWG